MCSGSRYTNAQMADMCLAGAERAREAGDAVASLALAITAAQFLQLQKLLERNDQ